MSSSFDDIENRILFEDNHLIIINKRAGEIVQGDKSGDIPLVEKTRDYLKIKYHKPGNVFCGLVHRIDRPVSGIVIFAKTSKALARMNEMIKNHNMTKIYHAIVEKAPVIKSNTLINYIKRDEKLNKSFISQTPQKDTQKAELSYSTIGNTDNYTLLEITLITGRHHQIRAQLAANNTIIKGDLKYGAKRSNRDGSISLHSAKIIFEHPTTKNVITVIAEPLSDEFKKIWNNAHH